MVISFTTILHVVLEFLGKVYPDVVREFGKWLFVAFTVILFIVCAICWLLVYVMVDFPNDNIGHDYEWIVRESRLLRSVRKDVEHVLSTSSLIDGEAHKLWPTEEHNQEMNESLKNWSVEKNCVHDLFKKLRDCDKTFQSRWDKMQFGHEIMKVKGEIENYFKEKQVEFVSNLVTLESLRSKIRKLQDRPIAGVRKVDKQLIADLLADVHKVDGLNSEVQKVDNHFASDTKEDIQSFTLHLALIRAFLTDLQWFGLETEMEKTWLEEAKKIVGAAQKAIEKFRQETSIWMWVVPKFGTNKRARNELKKEMKRINREFSDFLDRKKRYGFHFNRSFIRREKDPSKSFSGTSQRQASEVQASDDELITACDEEKLKDKFGKLLQDPMFQVLLKEFREVQKKIEDAKNKEAITSSTKERLNQMGKLAKKTEYYLENFKKNSVKNHICKRDRIRGDLDILDKTREAYSIEIREETGVVGLYDDIQAVVSQLKSGNEHVVCIVGMRGIGKTTLAKNIYDESTIVDYFPVRAWVALTQTINDDAICEDVAKQVLKANGSKEEENIRGDWKNRVCDILRKRRYLVVLDNFTEEIHWGILQSAFPKTTGSRILLTTRDRCVATEFGRTSKIHYLRLRTKEESWRLFIQMAEDFETADENVKKKAEEIVGKCVGLPLQILYFGYLMSEKVKNNKLPDLNPFNPDKKPWLEYLKPGSSIFLKDWLHSQHIDFKDWPDHEGKDWPDNLSKILSLFDLFPSDYEIRARRLVALSIAEELVAEGYDKKTPKDLAMDYLSELIDLNLIQAVEMNIDGKVKICRLPGAIREHKIFRSLISDKHLADHCDKNSDSFNDIHGNCTNSQNFQKRYKNLVSYLSFDNGEGYKPGEDIKNFLQKGIANECFQSLKVLDLENVFRPQLPNTIGQLVQLMYLGLRWTYLEEIPSSIGNLLKLQTLDVAHTYVKTLPKSIWKLQKLRHLYLNESHRGKFVSQPRSSSLKNLRTLWGLFLDDFSAVKNGLNNLKGLTKLGLSFQLESGQQGELAKWVKRLKCLKSLRLRSVDEKGDAMDLQLESLSELKNLSSLYLFGKLNIQSIESMFPTGLSDLTMSASGLKEDPMPTLGSLSSLKSLCFYSGSYEPKVMVCPGKGFPNLLVLKLWRLQQLEELKVEKGAMPKLRELEIRCCEKLKDATELKHFMSLQELKLTNMPKDFTKNMKETKWKIWDDIAHPPWITEDNWQCEMSGR